MPDMFDPVTRSTVMRAVRQENRAPELLVRRALHRMGYRFRPHRCDLPGRPDIVLPKHKAVVFVYGCFWHGHPGCRRATRPTSNVDFWNHKLDRNIERDRNNSMALEESGWRVLVVWGCSVKTGSALEGSLKAFLSTTDPID